MNVIPFKFKYIPPAFGFRNMGVTCYFNALLQGLLTCTSLTEVFLNNRHNENFTNNAVATIYLSIIDAFLVPDISDKIDASKLINKSPELWHSMIKHLRKHNLHNQFGHGQEDSYEGFVMLMQCWENIKEIRTLFEHTYHDNYLCPDCKSHKFSFKDMSGADYYNITETRHSSSLKIFNKKQEYKHESDSEYSGWIPVNTHFRINHDFTGGDEDEIRRKFGHNGKNTLQEFIMCPKTILKDVICDTCKSRCKKLGYSSLAVLPEILVVVIKKYHIIDKRHVSKLDTLTQLPDELKFESNSNKILTYKPIVQIMHSGGIGGGHYWAHAIRRSDISIETNTSIETNKNDYKWFNLNDSSATYISAPVQKFVSDVNSYTVIYHLI